MEFRKLKADEIELRVGVVHDKDKGGQPYKDRWFTLLLYKTARVDANILDETVGEYNWQKRFYQVKNTMICSIGIYNKERNEWCWKDDAGDETNQDAVKGEASDSFKRAGFAWGIGRELYNSPFVKINIDESNDPKTTRYEVQEIQYRGSEISKLIIVRQYTGEVVYSFPKNAKTEKPTNTQPKQQSVPNEPKSDKKGKIDLEDYILINNFIMTASDEETINFNNYVLTQFEQKDWRELTYDQGKVVANKVRKKMEKHNG